MNKDIVGKLLAIVLVSAADVLVTLIMENTKERLITVGEE